MVCQSRKHEKAEASQKWRATAHSVLSTKDTKRHQDKSEVVPAQLKDVLRENGTMKVYVVI